MNHDDTRNPPVEGGDAQPQGANGLDAFSVQQGPAMQGEGGARGGHVDEPAAPVDPSEQLSAALAASTWGAPDAAHGTVAAALAARIARRASGEERPVVTPWENVNRALGGGLWPGVHFVIGPTGSGKSQWAMQATIHAARAGSPGLVFALELDDLGMFSRGVSFAHSMLCDDAGERLPRVAWSDLYTGRATPHPAAVEFLSTLPVHWHFAPAHGFQHEQLAPTWEAFSKLHPAPAVPPVVVVDFLQLVTSTNPREDIRERVGKAAYACREIARLGAVVIALSSTSRDNANGLYVDPEKLSERGHPKTPLHTLVGLGKESGDVEYSADSVLVLCPETWPEGEPPPRAGRRMHMAVAKLRAGRPSWCTLAFDGTRFAEAPPKPGDGEAWCEECDGIVRTSPHPSKPGALMCTRGGHTIEATNEGPVAPRSAQLPTRKPRRSKGNGSAPSETAPDTSTDHPTENDR